MFRFFYQFKKILLQRKVIIVCLRTSLKNNIKNMAFLIKNKISQYYQKIKGHKIICFTVLTMKNPKIQVYSIAKVYRLFARFIFCRFKKMKSLRTFLRKDKLTKNFLFFNEKKFKLSLKHRRCNLLDFSV